MLTPPLLSAPDPEVAAEGSIDPLSLAPVYDRLADRILPSLTVRMRRIRFVTAMCAAARVCGDDYADDDVASDEVTPPWLVFEWYVVESLGRTENAEGVPGGLKVRTALRQGRAVGHASYLKTPKVFGYSGIFRRLATEVGVLTEELALDDGGIAVLQGWEKDLGLDGFLRGDDKSTGGKLRDRLRSAVRTGMDQGKTAKRSSDFWSTVAQVFEPGAIKQHERKALRTLLVARAKSGQGGHADEIVRALLKRGETLLRDDECKFLRATAKHASPDLARCLRAIDAYEALCRPVTDAFDLVRALSTAKDLRPVGPAELGKHRLADKLLARIAVGVHRVQDDAHLGAWEPSTLTLARTFAGVSSAPALFETVLQHHEVSQKAKPPDGKRAWFERGPGKQVSIRMLYALGNEPTLADGYVHQYRVPTLSRFLSELGAL